MPALVCPLGPNPAPFTEALWCLARSGARVEAAWVVFESEAARVFFEDEVASPGGPLDQLRGAQPALAHLIVHRVGPRDPGPEAFTEAAFQAMRAAQARHDGVVLTLSGGRWRGSAAATTVVFQLLARPTDRLADVRVDTPAAEGGSGFFFPTQRDRLLRRRGGVIFEASQVGVSLHDLAVPRLRPFLPASARRSLSGARAASAAALAAAAPPTASLDLFTGAVCVLGRPVVLPETYLPYVVWAWVDHMEGGCGVPVGDPSAFRAFALRWQAAADAQGVQHVLQRRKAGSLAHKLLDRGVFDKLTDGDLAPQISRARRRLRLAVEAAIGPSGAALVPSPRTRKEGAAKQTRHTLDLARENITLVGVIEHLPG
jgi:hypothetical protein